MWGRRGGKVTRKRGRGREREMVVLGRRNVRSRRRDCGKGKVLVREF